VTDFGLARQADRQSSVSQSGAIVGSPSYMAPEQARAEKQLTTAADVYSLGAVLYECLTGRPPFLAANVMDTLLQAIHHEPEHPGGGSPGAAADLGVIAMKCRDRAPARRYESGAALADEVERWLRGEPILARAAGPVQRVLRWTRRKPVIAALAVSLLLVAC